MILQGQLDPAVAPRNARAVVRINLRARSTRLPPESTPIEHVLGLGTEKSYRRVDMLRGQNTVLRPCEITRLEHAWSGATTSIRYHAQRRARRLGADLALLQGQRRSAG